MSFVVWLSGPGALAADTAPSPSPLPSFYEDFDVLRLHRHVIWNAAERSQGEFVKEVELAAREYDLPSALLRALVLLGSNGKPQVTSRGGRIGLMQLHPGSLPHVTNEQRRIPMINIREGARQLRAFADRVNNNPYLTIASHGFGADYVLSRGEDVLDEPEVRR